MTRTYNVVDADGHILEPLDLWDRYMDPAFRDPPRFRSRIREAVRGRTEELETLAVEMYVKDALADLPHKNHPE